MQARSELSDAANSAADANTRRLLHQATDSLDGSIDQSLETHDAANGTDLKGQRLEANKLWTKKYALQHWRDGLQDVMEDQPSQGVRTINEQKFQKLVNKLDPPGGRESRSTLQTIFADSPKDLSEVSTFRQPTYTSVQPRGWSSRRCAPNGADDVVPPAGSTFRSRTSRMIDRMICAWRRR